MSAKYEAVFCIVNSGFADAAMDAARKAGAGGGTILKGRGTAGYEAEKLFNIRIQPEKELLMLLVPEETKDNVLRILYDAAGLDSAGQGIAFSIPVEKAVGLTDRTQKPAGSEAEKN
ncbi:MAG: P-II family nitrogen regulator [Oscillospiraceae bacterium]|nr:P-II family nitrogen regulator [Oscillospiraceae bacterium]